MRGRAVYLRADELAVLSREYTRNFDYHFIHFVREGRGARLVSSCC